MMHVQDGQTVTRRVTGHITPQLTALTWQTLALQSGQTPSHIRHTILLRRYIDSSKELQLHIPIPESHMGPKSKALGTAVAAPAFCELTKRAQPTR